MIPELYRAASDRYDSAAGMRYRRAGKSGVMLPAISLGLWKNFGGTVPFERSRAMLHFAFDHGITHFDLANNYGPPYGSAEETFGRMMKSSFAPYRDEMFISTKAGYDMWPGPYGNWGSRKYLMASLDQSLQRMNLDYVDVFYIHRYDPATPLDETLRALVDIVRSGKALYAGISNWPYEALDHGLDYLDHHECHALLLQSRLSILDQRVSEEGNLDLVRSKGTGFIAFSPLAEGLLTDRYLSGTIPADSRAARRDHLTPDRITADVLRRLNSLDAVARRRGQSLAQMSLAWVLNNSATTSVIVGASSVEQLSSNLKALENTEFSEDELREIANLARGV